MAKRLTDFLDPRTLNITLSDIAQGIEIPIENIYLPHKAQKASDWKWANVFLVVVDGVGGRFCSYRVLRCWLEAVVELLTSCMDWQTLAELIEVTQWELQHFNYPEAHKKHLEKVLLEQKARLEELRVQADSSIKAWEWARGWEPIIKSCPDEPSLDIAVQLFKTQRRQYAAYQEAIAWVQGVGKQHRACLQRVM
jgi:hypothetical protein